MSLASMCQDCMLQAQEYKTQVQDCKAQEYLAQEYQAQD